MKKVDSIDQIIDLEYFLHADTLKSTDELHLRDREIGISITKQDEAEKPNSSELLAGWTQTRSEEEFAKTSQQHSPGDLFSQGRALASALTAAQGLLAGLLAGFAYFAYVGTTPINVLEFLVIFVFSQLFVSALLLVSLLFRKFLPSLKLPSTSFYLLHTFGSKFFKFIHKKWFSDFPADKRDSIRHAFGIVRRNNQLYGSVFYWSLFSLAQLFGVTFNAGLLASSLFKIVTSDLAFGWQSTLQLSSKAIEKMVHLFAVPWQWLLPEAVGTPSLTQIEGSHIILKDGIYHLATTDLVAWWPFLILCLLVYGLLTRTVFYLTGRFMEKSSLGNLQFNSPECKALLRRMRTPVVTTQAKAENESTPISHKMQSTAAEKMHINQDIPQVVLIPDEIYELATSDELHQAMKDKGLKVKDMYRFMIGYDEDQELLTKLSQRTWSDEEGIFIIMESWMVPLVDFILFLQELRKLSTKTTNIEIGLTGKSTEATFATVEPSEMDIWRKKIQAIGDPFIQLLPVTGINQ